MRYFGCDPEFFVCTNDVNSSIVPPAALIEDFNVFPVGENSRGKRIFVEEEEFRWIEDGAALELNLKRGVPKDKFNSILRDALASSNYFVRGIKGNLHLSTDVTHSFDVKKYWEGRDEKFLDCVRFGCDPDEVTSLYSDYDSGCKILDVSKHSQRYAGGHLHMQNMSDDPEIYLKQVKYFPIVLDFVVGLTNISFVRSRAIELQEAERLKYFGFPGRFRFQEYGNGINGIEYRPPSNHWITKQLLVENILSSANVACNIIEQRMAELFVSDFYDYIPKVYALLSRNINIDFAEVEKIKKDIVSWCLKYDFLNLFNVGGF